MKRTLFYVIAIGAINGFFMGCTSDNGIDCPADYTGALAENEEKLTGEWVLSAITADKEIDLTDDDEDNPEKDIYAQYSECLRDGSYDFSADRKYTFNQGQNATDCRNKASSEGTWKLTAETLSLVGTCNAQNIVIDIDEQESSFSFSDDFNVRDVDGTTVQAKITFTYSTTP
ncbi:DUF5004 domain-containing protein [Pricia sp.]|uniref:DUF5004 domain-containing protein n=1 Tax=Pricia sp. TaxID=2268138 RepID=UPI0035948D2A